MTDRKKPSIPFYNMHGHTTFSIFDGMGYPDEHADYGFQNGLEGMAFTEHGNMNSFSYAFQKSKKMKEEGKDFKIVYGIEAYIHPSIEDWKQEKQKHKEDAKLAKQVDEDVGLVVEDESETKKGSYGTLNQRSHLVLNAINQEGLNNLFKLVSNSYRGDNFYRYPRMDYDLLRKHNSGIIASSACLTGDTIVETSNGKITLKQLVDTYKTKNIYILSYDEGNQKPVYSLVSWGDITRKNEKVLQLTLKNGKKVKLTSDHKVFTDKGWMEAGELKNHPNIKILSFK
jgi:DNA polymerase-3 subunit alpha